MPLRRSLRNYRDAASKWVQDHPQKTSTIRLVARLFLTCAVIPGILALLGYIIETAIYIPGRRTYFHTLYITVSGWIAAPLILVRWYWRWPMHLTKLEFIIYILQSSAFFVTIREISQSGNDLYHTNSYIRQQFLSDQFKSITVREDMWKWLYNVMDYVYNRDGEFNAFSRQLTGRMAMTTAIRLRQNRVKPRNCTAFYKRLEIAGTSQCYPPFSSSTEDRTTYGELLRFQYYNNSVNSTTGYPISMEDYKIQGQFGAYPLAGFWLWFPPPLNHEGSKIILDLAQNSTWIDDQTRSVGLDVGITLPDFGSETIFAFLNFVVEVNQAGKFVPMEPHVHVSKLYSVEGELEPESIYNSYLGSLIAGFNLNSLEHCIPVVVLRPILLPMYLGFLPFIVYLFTVAIIQLVRNWRGYLNKPFNVTELFWCVFVLCGMGFQMFSLRFVDCGSSVFEQTVLDKIIGTNFTTTSSLRYAVRFELLPMAAWFTDVRRLLGIAIFVHLFNFLKFLVRLKALGVLVRTLRFAAAELLSFSFSFLILFAGFVIMFYYIFSIESSDFRTVTVSIATLWLGMLGELELTPELWRGGNITVAMFIIFTFLSAFVLLTTIVSIIGRAHDVAHKYDLKEAAALKKKKQRKTTVGRFMDVAKASTSGDEEVDGGVDTDDDKAQLVEEGEAMLKTLKRWHSSMVTQRRGRKIGTHNSDSSPWKFFDDGASEGAGNLTPSATNSMANLFNNQSLSASRQTLNKAAASSANGGWVDLPQVQDTAKPEKPPQAATEATSSV